MIPGDGAVVRGSNRSKTASNLAYFQGRQHQAPRFAGKRREIAPHRRPDRTLPRPTCLVRCPRCGAPPLRVTSGERGRLPCSSYRWAPPLDVTRGPPGPVKNASLSTWPKWTNHDYPIVPRDAVGLIVR
jgi:hypothetical protein